MNRFLLGRLVVLLCSAAGVASVGTACAGAAGPRAEAVSAQPAPLTNLPIAPERAPEPGVPLPQTPAIGNPPAPAPAPLPPVPPVTATTTPATPTAAPAAGAGYVGPDPCVLATKGDSPIAKACREGGIKAAKQAMKELTKAGRAAGVKYQCDDCHTNDADYAQLGKGAEEKFARLVAASRK